MVCVFLEFIDKSELVSAAFNFLIWNPRLILWQHILLVMGFTVYFQVKGKKKKVGGGEEEEENGIHNVIIFKWGFYKQFNVKAHTN